MLSRAKGHILEDSEAARSDVAGDLVGEALELSEADALAETVLLGELHGELDSIGVVRGDEERVLVVHVLDQV